MLALLNGASIGMIIGYFLGFWDGHEDTSIVVTISILVVINHVNWLKRKL